IFILDTDGRETIGDKLINLVKRLGLDHEQSLLRPGGNIDQGQRTSLKQELLGFFQSQDGKGTAVKGDTALNLLGEITGLQLLNIAEQQNTLETTFFLGNWMLTPGKEELHPLYLKIKKYGGRDGSIQGEDAFQILFFINTQNLGQVICRLTLGKEHLTCGFTTRGMKEKDIIDNNLNILKKGLEKLPWKVALFPTKIESQENIQATLQEEFFEISPGIARSLDVKI
ncbi:MAG: hypothetical protein GX318_07740, partial [Clostridia bacterium]|nr:hypothetical protein [Clostridia bacterium]